MSLSSASTQVSVTLPQRIIETNSSDFREKFNRSHFRFAHNLANHPLFELPRLIELAQTLSQSSRGGVCCQAGNAHVQQRPTELPLKNHALENLANIATSESIVLLAGAQVDPDYQTLLDKILLELEALTAVSLKQQISWVDAYVFVSSPYAITPYHIDHESNFLFQAQGHKDVYLFDQTDRLVLTEPELEGYYIGDLGAATYREEVQRKATLYSIVPGQGVHHPVNAPHWVKTRDSVSVTLSVLFFMRPYDLRARVYQMNYYLHKLGFRPTPPGQAVLENKAKIFTLGLLSKHRPATKYEVVRSGITRAQKAAHRLTRLIRR